MNPTRISCAILAGALLAATPFAFSQERFPNRPVRIITQFGPGTAIDLASRALAEGMGPQLGVPVIVESRPGAGGQIAVDAVKAMPADGYATLIGGQTSLVTLPIIDPANAGNPLADFKAVSFVTEYDLVLLTSPGTGIKSARDLVARLRTPNADTSYMSLGVGTPVDLAALYFIQASGGKANAIPYKNASTAHADVTAGRLAFSVDTITPHIGRIKEKLLIPLAVFAEQRSPLLPDTPTMAEAGMPEVLKVNWRSWNALLVRNGTPQPAIERLNDAAGKVLGSSKFKDQMEQAGQGVVGVMNAREAQAKLEAQIPLWRAILQGMKVAPQN